MLQHLPDIDQPSPSTLRRDHVPQHGHLLDPAHVLYLSVMVGTMYLGTNDDMTDKDLIPLLFHV
ncbi:hypothetical protein PF010_g11788 [Phytophthora fragariae]|uniref:Uncharacterized protein n=1 Tax=Phytophthora fragariae TaxID=53985 RepID=A0A6G0L5F5_9STRA|nr:hypothetical protein PF010_g11788 [Phytophthora fragariae]